MSYKATPVTGREKADELAAKARRSIEGQLADWLAAKQDEAEARGRCEELIREYSAYILPAIPQWCAEHNQSSRDGFPLTFCGRVYRVKSRYNEYAEGDLLNSGWWEIAKDGMSSEYPATWVEVYTSTPREEAPVWVVRGSALETPEHRAELLSVLEALTGVRESDVRAALSLTGSGGSR